MNNDIILRLRESQKIILIPEAISFKTELNLTKQWKNYKTNINNLLKTKKHANITKL